MRKFWVLLTAVFAFSAALFAQQTAPDLPNTEIFAGYSYLRSDLQNEGLGTQGLNGFTLQATKFLHENLGFTADVSRVTGSNVDQSGVNVYRYTYLFGPTYAYRSDAALTPYVHVLFGADHERFSTTNGGFGTDTYSTSFATALGGGLDARMTDHLALRLGEVDYIYTDRSGASSHFRYSAGLVLKF